MATITGTAVAKPPLALHIGANWAHWQYTGSVSAGDIILMGNIPHGALIVDYFEEHTSSQTTLTIDLGLQSGAAAGGGGNASAIATGLAKATANRGTVLLPVRVSLSDNAMPRQTAVVAKVSAGTSEAGCNITLNLVYMTDGQ